MVDMKTEELKLLDTGKDWNKIHEEILKEWKAKCFVNLWLQNGSAYYYTKMYNYLSYPVIAISSVVSAALFSTNNEYVKFGIGLLTLASGVLTAITRQMKPGELNQQHASIAKRYENIIRAMDTCLSLTQDMRPTPASFLEKMGNEIDILEAHQIDPPLSVVKKFENQYCPLHRALYGEDLIELMKIEMNANKVYSKMHQRVSDISSSDALLYSPNPRFKMDLSASDRFSDTSVVVDSPRLKPIIEEGMPSMVDLLYKSGAKSTSPRYQHNKDPQFFDSTSSNIDTEVITSLIPSPIPSPTHPPSQSQQPTPSQIPNNSDDIQIDITKLMKVG
jgi:hypothetical protein